MEENKVVINPDEKINDVKEEIKDDSKANEESLVPQNKKLKKKNNFINIILLLVFVFEIGLISYGIINQDKLFNHKNNKTNNNSSNNVLNDEKNDKEEKEETPLPDYAVTLSSPIKTNGLEDFDLAFLQMETNKKNMVYSPLSIKYALAMLKEAASGNSKAQIESILGDYEPTKYTNSKNMNIANAIFIRDKYQNNINGEYLTTLKNKFNASVTYDPFKTPNNINKWVKDNTFGMIDSIINDTSDLDYLLINTLAIDMDWKKVLQAKMYDNIEFDYDIYSVVYPHENYSDAVAVIGESVPYDSMKFNGIEVKSSHIAASVNKYDIINELGRDNIEKTVTEEYKKWMKENPCGLSDFESVEKVVSDYLSEINSNYKKEDYSTDFRFFVDDNVKVFAKELKEYNGVNLEYIGIMPIKEDLTDYIHKSNAKSINDLISKLKSQNLASFDDRTITHISGHIPYFKYEYELSIQRDLDKLGIKDIFEPGKASLSNLTSDKNSSISKMIHKTQIEFNNEGIKAAVASSSGGWGGMSCDFDYIYDVPVKEIDLTFDKPYMYIIRNKNNGEVWFTGNVYNPDVLTQKDIDEGKTGYE